MPELVFFRRGDEVLRFSLSRPRTVLGRGERSDVVIPDPEVSRTQAALVIEGERVSLEDLSGHGTRVAGNLVQRAVLADGADIVLGQWRAIFRERSRAGAGEAVTEVGLQTEAQPRDSSAPRWESAQVRVRRAGQETLHRLLGESFTVGKEPGNDLILEDRFVSGRHVKVVRREDAFQVLDQGSTNGTFIAGLRIYEAVVPLFTTIRVGETELTLEPVEQTHRERGIHGLVGSDPSMRQLLALIERVAPSSAAVAIFGESGTGKEVVAQTVHAQSLRVHQPFIPVNCAAISKELIESELFGHEKGAFTGATTARKGAFEEAEGGTLFLDEIGELPMDLQPKLLRALESGEIKRVGAARPIHVDVRVVAATNRDLLGAVRAGRFREDLYYRLCVIPLYLPPLRSRRSDILPLAEHFVRMFSPQGQTLRFTPDAMTRLQEHHWPGNIRELRNVIHRALLLRKGPMIDAPDVSFDQELNHETGVPIPDMPGLKLEEMLEKLERQIIESALRRYNNNRERVARELGVARSTLFKRLREWGITRPDEVE